MTLHFPAAQAALITPSPFGRATVSNSDPAVIEAAGLGKRFGKGDKSICALDGLDLVAPAGQVTAVLGPNGAGKTTFVRAVATLHLPDGGSLHVAGIDAVADPERVRRAIGLAGQHAAVEPALTGRENLVMVARLFGHDRRRPADAADDGARPARPDRRRRPPRARLLGRHAPPPRPRRQPRRRAPAAAARRADHRPRPAQPHRAVGRHPGARRRRHRRAADDAVPRGGRPAGRPRRDHRPRPGDRHRHAGRAEGPGRSRRGRDPRPPRRRPRRAARGARRSRQRGARRSTSRTGGSPSPSTTAPTRLADAVRVARRRRHRDRRRRPAPADARRGLPRPHRSPDRRRRNSTPTPHDHSPSPPERTSDDRHHADPIRAAHGDPTLVPSRRPAAGDVATAGARSPAARCASSCARRS